MKFRKSYRDFVACLQDVFGSELVGGCCHSNCLDHLIAHHGLILRHYHGHNNKSKLMLKVSTESNCLSFQHKPSNRLNINGFFFMVTFLPFLLSCPHCTNTNASDAIGIVHISHLESLKVQSCGSGPHLISCVLKAYKFAIGVELVDADGSCGWGRVSDGHRAAGFLFLHFHTLPFSTAGLNAAAAGWGSRHCDTRWWSMWQHQPGGGKHGLDSYPVQ